MFNKNYEIDKTIIGRFSYNDDLLEILNKFCSENNIRTGWISIIGAVKKARFGYYDQNTQEYLNIQCQEFTGEKGLEIASSSGNISIKDDKPFVHLHAVVTDEKGNAFGGHLIAGTIIFAGEFIIQSFKGEDLIREKDQQTGLPLWKTDKTTL